MVILKSDSKDFGAGRRLTLIKFPILYLVVEFEKSPQTETPQVTSPLLADYCVRGTRTQPLICVGCSVHYWVSCAINKGGFFETAFVVDTHLPRFEALAYVLPHFDALTHVVIRVFSAFIFQTFAEVCYSVFVNRSSFKSVLTLHKAYIFQSLLKVFYRSVFNESSKAFIFQKRAESLHPE